MSKHTPGPWYWNKDLGAMLSRSSGQPVVMYSDYSVDRMSGRSWIKFTKNVDRALIAAAPDLLAACEQALAAIDADNAHMEVGRHYAVDDARGVLIAAIAKAKGKTS